jgi:transcriptional regulator with XRE-family HTH domain
MTDIILPSQVRAARALLDWSQEDLASAAALSSSTVKDFEAGRRDPSPENIAAMRRSLMKAGVLFMALNEEGGPGVRLASEMPKITRRPKEVSFETNNLVFRVSWRREEVFVMLPDIILDDLDRTNYHGDAEFLAAFAKHEKLILQKTAQALYSGRADAKGRLQLRSKDFPELRHGTR